MEGEEFAIWGQGLSIPGFAGGEELIGAAVIRGLPIYAG
jgi:hypothetical protein